MAYFNGKIFTTLIEKPYIGETLKLTDDLTFVLNFTSGQVQTISPENGNNIASFKVSSTIKENLIDVNPLTAYLVYQNFFILYYTPGDSFSRYFYVWNFDRFGILVAAAFSGRTKDKVTIGKNYGEREATTRLAEASLIPTKFLDLVSKL